MDLSNIYFTLIEGYDVLDPNDGSMKSNEPSLEVDANQDMVKGENDPCRRLILSGLLCLFSFLSLEPCLFLCYRVFESLLY